MRPLITILLLSIAAHAGTCTPFESASEKIGEVACIKGRIRKVSSSPSGTWFLNYCEDHINCQFSVVVFARDLRDVGDIRALEGKDLEITGKVKSYKGQPEIILKDRSQLRGEYANLPKLPKDFDVARKGSYSAGTFKSPSRPTGSYSTKKPTDSKNPDREPAEE
jgi:hypothetical protein